MEASGTPTPQPGRPQPPPPPPPGAPEEEARAGGGWRALAVVLALALAFACAVMVIAMADIGDTPTCDDLRQEIQESVQSGGPPPTDDECFDGSSGQKTASLILGWPSGVLAGIAALVALFFAATGRRGRLLLQLTGAAIVLGALSIVIGSV
jgi:hypothetical protein